MNAGDLVTAREYLPLAVRHYRDAGDMRDLSIGLLNLAECLGYLGEIGPARDAAAEALSCGVSGGDRMQIHRSHVSLGWLAGLGGDAAEAGDQFTAADQIWVADTIRTVITCTRWAGSGGRNGWPAPGGPARPGH